MGTATHTGRAASRSLHTDHRSMVAMLLVATLLALLTYGRTLGMSGAALHRAYSEADVWETLVRNDATLASALGAADPAARLDAIRRVLQDNMRNDLGREMRDACISGGSGNLCSEVSRVERVLRACSASGGRLTTLTFLALWLPGSDAADCTPPPQTEAASLWVATQMAGTDSSRSTGWQFRWASGPTSSDAEIAQEFSRRIGYVAASDTSGARLSVATAFLGRMHAAPTVRWWRMVNSALVGPEVLAEWFLMYLLLLLGWSRAAALASERTAWRHLAQVLSVPDTAAVPAAIRSLSPSGRDARPLALVAAGDLLERMDTGATVATSAVEGLMNSAMSRLEAGRWLHRWCLKALPAVGFLGTVRGILFALRDADEIVRAFDQTGRAAAVSNISAQLGLSFSTTLYALAAGLVCTLLFDWLTAREDALLWESERWMRDAMDVPAPHTLPPDQGARSVTILPDSREAA